MAKELLRNNFPFLEQVTIQPERQGVVFSEVHTSYLLGVEGCVKGTHLSVSKLPARGGTC